MYHVLNRANARMRIFDKPGDYDAFAQRFGLESLFRPRGRPKQQTNGSTPFAVRLIGRGVFTVTVEWRHRQAVSSEFAGKKVWSDP